MAARKQPGTFTVPTEHCEQCDMYHGTTVGICDAPYGTDEREYNNED